MLIAGFGSHSLHTRQRFEHALDALLAALSGNALFANDFQRDRFEHVAYRYPYARAGSAAAVVGGAACPTVLIASKK